MQEKSSINLKTPVRYLKGVGPKKGEWLAKAGIRTIEDILYYLPKRYEDRSDITLIKDLKPGESRAIQGEIIVAGLRRAKSGAPIFQAAIADTSGIIHAIWFNQPYLKDSLKKGDKVILYGKVERYDKMQIVQPEYEVLSAEEIARNDESNAPRAAENRDSPNQPFDKSSGLMLSLSKHRRGIDAMGQSLFSINIGRIVPVYPLTEQLTQRYLRALVFKTLSEHGRQLTEKLPTYIRAREKLVDIRFAIHNIHFPNNFDMLEKAYKRIVFEEFFILQLALAIRKKGASSEEAAFGHHMTAGGLSASFKKSLPFELTDGQKKAISDIEADMSSAKPMNRLLEGDVGSGKTVIAAHALVLATQNGFQGVIMAPTEVLARQHFITLSELLMPLGINIVLLTGGMKSGDRARLYSEIKSGKINIAVGTHAIIQEGVEFKNLGLAIIDEQHKFGVAQRAILREKGYKPHILVMTATPIPRTLALTVYGDLDISVIRELPKGRKPIATYWVEEAKRDEVYEFVREELRKGRQAYVVCPLIDKGLSARSREGLIKGEKGEIRGRGGKGFGGTGEGREATSAVETFERLKKEVFKEFEVGILHGRMPSKEKEKVMREFKKGKIKALVSTIVIEVGIDIPNATVMLIEGADAFGLSQLHQLRGRIGRGAYESYCILLADPRSTAAVERLKAIEGTLDGFEIAEADMDIRGPGEIFGTRQHGLPEIRFGDIARDFGIMELARKEAFALVERDPNLREEHHRLLKQSLYERFRGKMELVRVG